MARKCACCNRPAAEIQNGTPPQESYRFCSVECAVMSGRFSVRDGWINQDQPIKRYPPKQPWYLDTEAYLDFIARFGWEYRGGQYVLKEETKDVERTTERA